MKGEVIRTERGWAGHFCCADKCMFKRNTLLEYNEIKIVVSTVGAMRIPAISLGFQEVGAGRFYETMCFHSKKDDETYHDADVSKEIFLKGDWNISKITDNSDKEANDMHEKVVNKISNDLLKDYYA